MDTGDSKQVNKKKTKIQLRRMRENAWLKEILSKEGGRDFIWRLLIQCGVYHTSFTGDAPQTFFNEGKRQIGLWVLTEIDEADIHAMSIMQEENK
ncbi:hypothetical protein LCGC14_1912840 [marine sediment metagenome]|uniref:Bbp19-like phage domain-containing protein n=1 Tax=marine sediment metagenome TaxID=412755 RepID=A0A0F9IR45_9ZZZZ